MEVLMLAVDAATVFRESTVSVTGQVYDRNSSHIARLQTRINAVPPQLPPVRSPTLPPGRRPAAPPTREPAGPSGLPRPAATAPATC